MTIDVKQWVTQGGYLTSSGSTGEPKTIFQPPGKILAMIDAATHAQDITSQSSVLTVCKLAHAGGLFAQSLPALYIGANVEFAEFNAYNFFELLEPHTHSHLTPDHCRALMGTKAWESVDLSGKWITCGSDNVEWDMIRGFVERGAVFLANWGMTEVGPVAINKKYTTVAQVDQDQALAPESRATIMGDTLYCETYIASDTELLVRGDITVCGNHWFQTRDRVVEIQGRYYYLGRKLQA
jgi:acyl-CoA synthetase (AMP-forming)/AMP-acid ligase II